MRHMTWLFPKGTNLKWHWRRLKRPPNLDWIFEGLKMWDLPFNGLAMFYRLSSNHHPIIRNTISSKWRHQIAIAIGHHPRPLRPPPFFFVVVVVFAFFFVVVVRRQCHRHRHRHHHHHHHHPRRRRRRRRRQQVSIPQQPPPLIPSHIFRAKFTRLNVKEMFPRHDAFFQIINTDHLFRL